MVKSHEGRKLQLGDGGLKPTPLELELHQERK